MTITKKIANTSNVQKMLILYQKLDSGKDHVPKMGLVLGEPGIGKTTAVTYLQQRTNCLVIECSPLWTKHSMLRAIAEEFQLPPTGTSDALLGKLIQALLASGRGIVFDECDDRLFMPGQKHGAMLDTIRYLYDNTNVPFLFVGYKQSERVIRSFPQLEGRITQSAVFAAMDLRDTRRFVEQYAEVEIADELVAEMHRATKGMPRQVVTAIEAINVKAKDQGWGALTLEQWGRDPFFPGDRRAK